MSEVDLNWQHHSQSTLEPTLTALWNVSMFILPSEGDNEMKQLAFVHISGRQMLGKRCSLRHPRLGLHHGVK